MSEPLFNEDSSKSNRLIDKLKEAWKGNDLLAKIGGGYVLLSAAHKLIELNYQHGFHFKPTVTGAAIGIAAAAVVYSGNRLAAGLIFGPQKDAFSENAPAKRALADGPAMT